MNYLDPDKLSVALNATIMANLSSIHLLTPGERIRVSLAMGEICQLVKLGNERATAEIGDYMIEVLDYLQTVRMNEEECAIRFGTTVGEVEAFRQIELFRGRDVYLAREKRARRQRQRRGPDAPSDADDPGAER